jgi:hypothetical protein
MITRFVLPWQWTIRKTKLKLRWSSTGECGKTSETRPHSWQSRWVGPWHRPQCPPGHPTSTVWCGSKTLEGGMITWRRTRRSGVNQQNVFSQHESEKRGQPIMLYPMKLCFPLGNRVFKLYSLYSFPVFQSSFPVDVPCLLVYHLFVGIIMSSVSSVYSVF